MPRRAYEAKSQKSAVGFKAQKGRVKFLFCSNALKTRAMKDSRSIERPIKVNKNTWVTTTVFTDWFNKYFVPEISFQYILDILNKNKTL